MLLKRLEKQVCYTKRKNRMDTDMNRAKRLSERIAEDILAMITVEKQFSPGDKLPNEIELAEILGVSRTTLREAIRILVTNGILEIQRGKGTFVKQNIDISKTAQSLQTLSQADMNVRDLYEIRLIFEPEAAYYATIRATDSELERIFSFGRQIEEKIKRGEDRTDVEQRFHKEIASATHNEFIDRLMPVIFQAIDQGVMLSKRIEQVEKDTIRDHQMIMEFMEARNPEGARSAMKIHILHAMKDMGME